MREKRGMFSSTCKNKKSQASIEYLMIAGFAFIIVIPMMYILYDYTTSLSKDVAESRISKAGNDLVNAAEQIYYLGPPSRTTLRFEMPETVQDIEIIDKAIIFSVGDISAPRKLTIFSKVDIISFLTPNDWAKGRHDYKIEADGTHVIIYTGDRETALMKATAYNFFKELMRQAELIDSADPLITVQIPDTNGVVKAYFNERTKEDTAYIYGALNKVDISANITFDVLEDEIHFWVGDINKKTLDIEISPSQFYSQYLDSLLIPIPVVSQGTTVTGNTFNINITTSLTEDCQIDLCSGGSAVPGQYNYLFIVSDMDGTVLMSDFIDVADAAPDSNWYFGDDSATGGRLIGSLSIAGYAISGDIQSNEVLSTIISRSLTIPINFTQIQLQVNNIFFNISVEKETYTKTVTASFKSYYPLIMTGFETAGVPERFDLGFPCLFTFTAQSGSVIITKPSPCVNT